MTAQLDLLDLLAEQQPAAPPCWCGHARSEHGRYDAARTSWAACSSCPCLGHHGVPVLGVAHAGRHVLWAWPLAWVLDGRRAALVATMHGGGGSCHGCSGYEYGPKGVTLGAWTRCRETARHSWAAILRELDRRTERHPDLAARILALGTDGYDLRRQIVADELWGCAA